VQLPPSLALDPELARDFFQTLRAISPVPAACEPRHPTWFTEKAERLLAELTVARVAADPPLGARGNEPGGWTGMSYYRLHGSPRIYYSAYPRESIEKLAEKIRADRSDQKRVWSIFDNTAQGEAIPNALELLALLEGCA
jgi:uncharacterized protein YecE (DUF72 family)